MVLTNGNTYFILIIPVLVGLFGWIAAVFWANNHSRVRHLSQPAQSMLAAGAADEGTADQGAASQGAASQGAASQGAVGQGAVGQGAVGQGAADESAEAGVGPGTVPQPRQQASQPPSGAPSVPPPSEPARGDRSGSAPRR